MCECVCVCVCVFVPVYGMCVTRTSLIPDTTLLFLGNVCARVFVGGDCLLSFATGSSAACVCVCAGMTSDDDRKREGQGVRSATEESDNSRSVNILAASLPRSGSVNRPAA